VKCSTIVRKRSSPFQTDHHTAVKKEMVDLYLASRRSRLSTINVTAESSDSVCTPHHPGRAFGVAHSYPLPPAFERTLSIPISRHHDILLLIRRHRLSPISSIPLSGIPEGRATLPHNRSAATRSSQDHHQNVSFSDCLVSILRSLSNGSLRRTYQRNYTTKKDVLSQMNSTL